MSHTAGQDEARAANPIRVRLPGFIKDEDAMVGLGDVVQRATSALGIVPCGGCDRRAAAMNRWMVFTR